MRKSEETAERALATKDTKVHEGKPSLRLLRDFWIQGFAPSGFPTRPASPGIPDIR